MAICKKCKATIEFMKTKTGKPMPVNPDQRTILLTSGEIARGWEPHWITCPAAGSFRKKQGSIL